MYLFPHRSLFISPEYYGAREMSTFLYRDMSVYEIRSFGETCYAYMYSFAEYYLMYVLPIDMEIPSYYRILGIIQSI